MITAQTVQLLDANNKNISPAVNIESLYFEGTISPTSPDTYRFALRDKLVVGGRLETIEPTANGSTNLYIPYVTASKAFNSSSGVWQIDSDKYDMGPATRDFIDAVCKDKYVTYQVLRTNYLDLQGNNQMQGAIRMRNGIVYGMSGVDSAPVTPKAYVHLGDSDGSVEISGQGSAKMSSGENYVAVNRTNAKLAYGSATSITGSSRGITAQTSKDISANADNIYLNPTKKLSVDAGSIDIDATTTVSINAGEIELYGKEFPQPVPGSVPRLLSATTSGYMRWAALGHLDIYNFGTAVWPLRLSYIEDSSITANWITFQGSQETYPVLSRRFKEIHLKSLKSGNGEFTLDASAAKNIYVSTINGQKMLADRQENIDLPTAADMNRAISTKIKSGSPQSVALLNIVGNDQTFEFTPSSVTIVDDIVYAKAFAMKSDRNLKTDIREDCFDREMPSIHGFKWIDSSAQSYGFVAQELEESGFQELVYEAPDGNKTVDYMAALSYKIAQLENENKRLWQEIEELKKKI